MRKLIALLMVLLMIAVPAFATGNLICDQSGLMTEEEVAELEALYAQYQQEHGFTPVFVTADSFDGLDAASYAEWFYDHNGYPQNGVLLLLSLQEGLIYIMTSGDCYESIDSDDLMLMNEELLLPLASGDYRDAAVQFAELAIELQKPDISEEMPESSQENTEEVKQGSDQKPVAKKIALSMVIGLVIGLIAVGIMAIPMRTVSGKATAADYIRPGSMMITEKRDIYLYSRTRRMAKSKSTNPGAQNAGNSAKQRGGAGKKL